VLDQELMVAAIDSLCQTAELKPGDSVRTLRGSTRGTIVRLRPDGRVVWRTDGVRSELTSLPKGLQRPSRKSRPK